MELPSDDEQKLADGLRADFLLPGEGSPYMVDIVRAMRLIKGRRRYVEVGTFDKGCLAYASTLLSSDALLIDVDIEARPAQTARLRRFARPTQELVTLVGDSTSSAVLDQVASALGSATADCIFIDGNHSAEFAWADYANFVRLLAPDGLMFFHDVYWQGAPECYGVSQAMEWIDRAHPVHVVFADHPVHRFFPMFEKSQPVWGGVGIIRA